ncbi:class I SAM-dependent methyltransferase [Candidatus Gottesmanbacteria bacterium]|nr:class I SAM-dependent methyltransferase [Candidatus Gottesmanbacteria bacterium]
MERLINLFYKNPFWEKIIPTQVYCLKKELENCRSVLDLGCGPDSPVKFCRQITYSVGVEIFKPYLKKSKIHNKYVLGDIRKVNFPKKSFDAVIVLDVLEHLPKNDGRKLIKKMENWAKKKIVINTPNGFYPQKDKDQNSHQRHLSGWEISELAKLGYKAKGMAGLKQLEARRNIFFVFSAVSQIFTYFFPKAAFEIFYVKKCV